MKFVALKELPQGQQPGDVFEATEDAGNVLIAVGAARRLPDDEDKPKRRYHRKDLEAEA